MELDAKQVLEVLRSKGIDALYHANTVRTSSAFLQHSRLMSRGVMAERGLQQTPQQTDTQDMRYGLWYDLFFDSVDIHSRAKDRSYYGPVLFVLDLDLLSQDWVSSVWITKQNPIHWQDSEMKSDRYFSHIDELNQGYQKGEFGMSLVLRHIGGVLRLRPYLKQIIVDNPERRIDEVDVYSQALGTLKLASKLGGLEGIPVTTRTCVEKCKCQQKYRTMTKSSVVNLFGV